MLLGYPASTRVRDGSERVDLGALRPAGPAARAENCTTALEQAGEIADNDGDGHDDQQPEPRQHETSVAQQALRALEAGPTGLEERPLGPRQMILARGPISTGKSRTRTSRSTSDSSDLDDQAEETQCHE